VLVRDRLQNGQKGWWVVTAFTVDGAPAVGGEHGAVIPVARGWIASPQDAAPPPPGPLTLTGRLEPSEAPQAAQDVAAGQIATLSVAQLINIWDVPSYTGFVGVTKEVTPSGAAAAATPGLEPLSITAQPVEQPVNWLNIFYAVEWVVFAGFSIFLWWRLVRDDYERTQDALADAAAAEAAAGGAAAPVEKPTPGAEKAPSETGGNRD
jgi:cytochrome oxidase assembly protein ShyY1